MAPRHTASPATIGPRFAVASGDVGGSGLIVVVIVAAWALFLVPQWLHRRAAAAARLADRVPDDTSAQEPEDGAEPMVVGAAPAPRGRFGRRVLARAPLTERPAGRFSRRFAGRVGGRFGGRLSGRFVGRFAGRFSGGRGSDPTASAPQRRRRILSLLAVATLLTAAVVLIGSLADLPVPPWLVAVPGGLMVVYLLLLAIVRPGAPRPQVPAEREEGRWHDEPVRRAEAQVPVTVGGSSDTLTASPAAVPSLAEDASAPSESAPARPGDGTWTPVPLPTPTYVTAPRAPRGPRIVRHIDLSNPGSWTAAASAVSVPTPRTSSDDDQVAVGAELFGYEHRRAVGD